MVDIATLTHLRPEARELASLPGPERLARMPANCWIGYTRANQAIALLERLLEREPGRVRPRNLLVVGSTNNGKTAIAERFLRAHRQHAAADGEHEIIPALLVQMPASPSADRLFSAILVGLGVPGAMPGRLQDREGMALRLLRKVDCRMLILDELQNLLAAPAPRQRELLNLLRYLGNELRIPLACLGTREAYLAIRSDDQLENRFEPFLLPPWEDGQEFGRLLASFEALLPLREPSGLGAPALRAHVLRRSEGTIGEVAALLSAATEAVLLAGGERIDASALDAADYQPPTVRRRLFERALRW
ncbi:MAG: TniB family NTP-binding protein [Stellaceae bacterium]